jgi:aldose 1-epimerase
MLPAKTPSIERVILSNNKNMQVVIANYGARILSIKYRNTADKWIETTLNYDSDEDMLADKCYMGATIGRVSNRISDAQYSHKGTQYKLLANDEGNSLHGGPGGFSQCIWSMSEVIEDEDGQTVTLTYLSKDGDQGFPGQLLAKVTYRLTADDRLTVQFNASSDKVGPINMCNHTYFTLGEGSIHDLTLSVYAKRYLEMNNDNLPTGNILGINDKYFSKHPTRIADCLKYRDADDCYIIEQNPISDEPKLACILTSRKHNIALSIYSDQIALQVYSGNYLPKKHSAIALEAQGLVDAVNHANFECDWLGPSINYQKVVHYQFQPV